MINSILEKNNKKNSICQINFLWQVLFFAFTGFPFTILGQSYDPAALDVLDKVGAKYKAYKSYRLFYTRQAETPDGKAFDKIKGNILVSGSKFVLTLPDQEIICNGLTIWTYLKDAKEVNISDYEPGEDEITPEQIFSLYQRGYKYVYWGEIKDKDGKLLQIVDLEPEDRKKEIMKVRIYVSKADKSVKRWLIFERGNANRQVYIINKLVPNLEVNETTFVFDKAGHKDVKIIDLR